MKAILACTDGSSYGDVCIRYAGWVARRTQAPVHVLYVSDIRQFEVPLVADLSGTLGLQPYQDLLAQLKKLEDRKAEIIAERSRVLLAEAGIPDAKVEFHHRTGLLVEVVASFEGDVDLVLLGKRGERYAGAPEHLGASMERVVRASRHPCLVTSRSFRDIRRVLFAYDGSPTCRHALGRLAHEAAWKDLELHVAHVAPEVTEEARELVNEAVEELRAGGYHPMGHVLAHDSPEDALARFVEDHGVDLLALGAYGHSRLRHLLIGSLSTTLIRTCHVPVLCLR